MAGVTWNCCRLGARTVYTIQPCTSLQCHFIQSHNYMQGACVFSCNLPQALLAEWPGSFTCYYLNTGEKMDTKISQHRKLTLEKKILPPHFRELEPETIQPYVWHSNHWIIPARRAWVPLSRGLEPETFVSRVWRSVGRFSKAGLLEGLRFVIFPVRSRERSQRTSGPISE